MLSLPWLVLLIISFRAPSLVQAGLDFGSWDCDWCFTRRSWCDWGINWCQWGRWWCDQSCGCKPTPTPTATPTEEPTPPPTEEPTPPPSEEPTPPPTLTPPPTTTPPPDTGDGEDGDAGGEGGPGGPVVCDAEAPPAPHLYRGIRVAPDKVDLGWTEVSPVTHYTIGYGLESGNYVFGVDNAGNVTSFEVGGLDSSATYYFVVKGVNDCAPGPWSNELSVSPGAILGERGEVLGISTLPETGVGSYWRHLFILGGMVGLGLGFRFLAAWLEAKFVSQEGAVVFDLVQRPLIRKQGGFAFVYQKYLDRGPNYFFFFGVRPPPPS